MIKNKKLFVIINCLFLLFLIGCNSSESGGSNTVQTETENSSNNQQTDEGKSNEISEEDKRGGHVTVRVAAQPTALGYPASLIPPSSSLPYAQPALETLGRYNPDGSMGPWLATDWEADPEEKTIKFTLREGVRFHDGTDFDAEAVKWNFEEMQRDGHTMKETLESVEILSSHEVLLKFNNWSTGRVEDFLWQYVFVSPKAHEDLGGKEGMMFHPVGTGPFKFDSMLNDTHIKWVRNDDYWIDGLPYLDSLEMKIIVDPNTAVNAFLGGEVDILPEVQGDVVDQYKDTKDFEIVEPVSPVGLLGYGFIGDSGNPDSPFADPRVRKAISYAIDTEAITQSIYKGYTVPANQYVLEGSWSYNPNLEKFDYNPEKAKELLAEAGYADGFKSQITAQTADRFLLQSIQGYLADVGVDVDINVVDRAKFNSLLFDTGWEGLIMYIYTTSNEITSAINPRFGKNAIGWGPFLDIPEILQQKMEEFDLETDREKRVEIAYELQSILMEEYHLFTPIMINKTPYFRYNYVHDDGYWSVRGMMFTPEKMWTEKK